MDANETAELLSRFGHSPGQLDYMEYLDERELALSPCCPLLRPRYAPSASHSSQRPWWSQ